MAERATVSRRTLLSWCGAATAAAVAGMGLPRSALAAGAPATAGATKLPGLQRAASIFSRRSTFCAGPGADGAPVIFGSPVVPVGAG